MTTGLKIKTFLLLETDLVLFQRFSRKNISTNTIYFFHQQILLLHSHFLDKHLDNNAGNCETTGGGAGASSLKNAADAEEDDDVDAAVGSQSNNYQGYNHGYQRFLFF